VIAWTSTLAALHAAPLAVVALVGIVVLSGVAVFVDDVGVGVGAVLPLEDPGRQ
jgi:hypothetical protein